MLNQKKAVSGWDLAGRVLGAVADACAEATERERRNRNANLEDALNDVRYRPMNAEQFSHFMNDLNAEWSKSGKMEIVHILARSSRGVSGNQLDQILRNFLMDSDQIEVIRLLADRVSGHASLNSICSFTKKREARAILGY